MFKWILQTWMECNMIVTGSVKLLEPSGSDTKILITIFGFQQT